MNGKNMLLRLGLTSFLHLGHDMSSRAESGHSMLKRFLSSSTGDLLQVFERFHLALTQQKNNIEVQWNDEKLKHLTNLLTLGLDPIAILFFFSGAIY
jgi:hypothetical protein